MAFLTSLLQTEQAVTVIGILAELMKEEKGFKAGGLKWRMLECDRNEKEEKNSF